MVSTIKTPSASWARFDRRMAEPGGWTLPRINTCAAKPSTASTSRAARQNELHRRGLDTRLPVEDPTEEDEVFGLRKQRARYSRILLMHDGDPERMFG